MPEVDEIWTHPEPFNIKRKCIGVTNCSGATNIIEGDLHMNLTKEEEAILRGERGEAQKIAMNLLVKAGEAIEAESLVQVCSAHIHPAMPLSEYPEEAFIDVVDYFASLGGRFKIITTLNPEGCDQEYSLPVPRTPSYLAKQSKLTELYKRMGAIHVWGCIPYFDLNVPRYGEHVAWGENTAAAYANTVLGARTNIEPFEIALAAALTGRAPNCGMHLDENRRGDVLVSIEETMQLESATPSDYTLLGKYLGNKLVAVNSKTPVIKGIPRNISPESMKNLVTCMTGDCGAPLYHIVGITPEARTVEEAFQDQTPKEKIKADPHEMEKLRRQLMSFSKDDKIDIVIFGCPHYHLNEIKRLAELLKGNRVHKDTQLWLCTNTSIRQQAKDLGYVDTIESAGGKVFRACGYMCYKFNPELNILSDYAFVAKGGKTGYAPTDTCIKAAIEGRMP